MSFEEWLETVPAGAKRDRAAQMISRLQEKYPQLELVMKWNQPMLTAHRTYIIGFSHAKAHLAVTPEMDAMAAFKNEIEKAGYSQTANLFRIGWKQPADYELLYKIVEYNLEAKKDTKTFWRS